MNQASENAKIMRDAAGYSQLKVFDA